MVNMQTSPGLQKRPSRFDRKYYFPDPNVKERTAYCHFWQGKLAGNDEIEFPDELCGAIASITDKFSFAYMQEAFVAALLAIARESGDHPQQPSDGGASVVEGWGGENDWVSLGGGGGEWDDLDGLVLWVEIKKQVEILREGMEEKK
jgi:transitional endoplasmic reticulum ATPase